MIGRIVAGLLAFLIITVGLTVVVKESNSIGYGAAFLQVLWAYGAVFGTVAFIIIVSGLIIYAATGGA